MFECLNILNIDTSNCLVASSPYPWGLAYLSDPWGLHPQAGMGTGGAGPVSCHTSQAGPVCGQAVDAH